MSGLDLALALLPLVLKAIKSYDDILSPFTRYKEFTREAKVFLKELSTQRTIFRNQCRNLLEEVVDHDAASAMLDSLTQETWHNHRLDHQLVQQLGRSTKACLDIVELIEWKLQDIESESQKLTTTLEEECKAVPKASRTRGWRKSVGTKLSFSFSKSRLDRCIAALRSYNDDLLKLSAQTIHQNLPHGPLKHPAGSRNIIQRYQTIGKASKQVYEALENACTKHTEHLAHFRVEVEDVVLGEDRAQQVKFNMAFTHMNLAGARTVGDPIWFVVDTTINDQAAILSNDQVNSLEDLGKTLKRQFEAAPQGPSKKKTKKEVRFHSPPPALSPNPTIMAVDAFLSDDPMRKDFCDKLRRCFRQPRSANVCVGILGSTDRCKHHIYPSPFTCSSQPKKAISLGHLIKTSSNPGRIANIPVHERVSLAKQLAIAVLQYHSTPWLRLSWRSDDILFFGNNESIQAQELPNFNETYINAKVKGPNGQPSRCLSFSPGMARNPILFSLGVIFLEIAHAASLESLQQPCDVTNGGEKYPDFFTARRLAKYNKNTVMGLRYHLIAQQLVECIFPCGDDLGTAQLQTAFYNDIICPLEDLEQSMRKLYITD